MCIQVVLVLTSGCLLASQVVVDMVKNRLAKPDAEESGWLLDGYPRSAKQAEAIEQASIRPDLFLLINVRKPPLSAAHGRSSHAHLSRRPSNRVDQPSQLHICRF
jgi:adenylate kinase family enzyme